MVTNNSAAKILVVDDDARLRDLVRRYLTDQGFLVTAVEDAEKLSEEIKQNVYDLLILDLMLPGEDGLSACRRMRADKKDIPIIMLTAKADDIDRILGLEMGADDYLPKPFNPRELLARINAVLRRKAREEEAARNNGNDIYQFGPYTLNATTRTLFKGKQIISLTSGEFSVLRSFVSHPKVPLSREKLMELSRGKEYDNYDRSLDVQISRLRKILETDRSKPAYIQTVWGVGYVFIPDA